MWCQLVRSVNLIWSRFAGFVGSSALTEASFPPDLAIGQLPCSSICVILLAVKASPTTVFPYEGTFTLPVHAHVRRTQAVQATATAPVSSMSIRRHNTVVAVASPAASGCA